MFNPIPATVTNGKSMSKLVAKIALASRANAIVSSRRQGKEKVAPVWGKATWLPSKLIIILRIFDWTIFPSVLMIIEFFPLLQSSKKKIFKLKNKIFPLFYEIKLILIKFI